MTFRYGELRFALPCTLRPGQCVKVRIECVKVRIEEVKE